MRQPQELPSSFSLFMGSNLTCEMSEVLRNWSRSTTVAPAPIEIGDFLYLFAFLAPPPTRIPILEKLLFNSIFDKKSNVNLFPIKLKFFKTCKASSAITFQMEGANLT